MVLTDLDLTLIDRNYQLTTSFKKIREVIQLAQKNNIILGLNSDSSFEYLLEWYKKLGLNGPIISERGARIWLPGWSKQIEVATPAAHLFPEMRERLFYLLHKDKEFVLLRGNANQIQRKYKYSESNKKLVIINNQRKRSLSFFVRSIDTKGNLIIDVSALNYVIEIFRKGTKKDFDVIWKERDEDINPAYGIYILHLISTQKHHAVKRLLNILELPELWMIGDSPSDYIESPQVRHIAVANARAEFKKKAEIITSQPITNGFIEFLKNII